MSENPIRRRCGKIAEYLPLIQAADGLTLSQVCKLSGLEPSTVQNWIKRGYVPNPVAKKYRERHLARILLISVLRESMQIDRIGALLRYVNGDTDDESDDIITEEALYDLFCEIAAALEREYPSPEEAEEIVVSKLEIHPGLKGSEQLRNALTIMAYTYMASLYKQEAEEQFRQAVFEDREET